MLVEFIRIIEDNVFWCILFVDKIKEFVNFKFGFWRKIFDFEGFRLDKVKRGYLYNCYEY